MRGALSLAGGCDGVGLIKADRFRRNSGANLVI